MELAQIAAGAAGIPSNTVTLIVAGALSPSLSVAVKLNSTVPTSFVVGMNRKSPLFVSNSHVLSSTALVQSYRSIGSPSVAVAVTVYSKSAPPTVALAWLLWLLAAVVFAITVIGIPFAKAAYRISVFAAFPFGRQLIDGALVGNKRIMGTGLINFLWCLLAGLLLAIGHILAGIACCLTIIGIPFGFAHFKLAEVSFAPLGKVIVSSEVAKAAKARSANEALDKSLAGK